MKIFASLYIRLRESRKGRTRGQTMAEYAMILSAIAVVVFVVYRTMGQTVENLVVWGSVHNDLLAT
jgi:Flp pilus assembly pilin Flp